MNGIMTKLTQAVTRTTEALAGRLNHHSPNHRYRSDRHGTTDHDHDGRVVRAAVRACETCDATGTMPALFHYGSKPCSACGGTGWIGGHTTTTGPRGHQ